MRGLLLIFLLFSSSALLRSPSIFETPVQRADDVVRAEVIERGRCLRMERTYCTYRCVVKEIFKGKLAVNDTIWVEVAEHDGVSLGGKFRNDTMHICAPGKEYVFFLNSKGSYEVTGESLYVPADRMLGVQRVTEQLLWELRE